MGLANLALPQKVAEPLGCAQLRGMGTSQVDPLVEGHGCTEKRFEAHRSRDGCRAGNSKRTPQRECAHGVDGLGAVEKREAFFGLKLDGHELRKLEGFATRKHFGVIERLPFADENERQVREGSKVSACAHGAFFRNDGEDVANEQLVDQLRNPGAGAAESESECVGAQQQERACFFRTERVPDAAGMAADKVSLQSLELLRRDHVIAEAAESGVDSVSHLAAREEFRNRAARGLHADYRSRREFGGLLAGSYGSDLGEGERSISEEEHKGHHTRLLR